MLLAAAGLHAAYGNVQVLHGLDFAVAAGGVTALLGMLNSCSPNVTVVNIDNGFGAGYVATLYATRPAR